jgi:alpha-beta hydrolase superfamily lysophospholipase
MFAKKVQSDNPDLPMFLLGHSMGGTIATQCMRGHFDLFVGAMLRY